MNREEKTNALIENDIKSIKESSVHENYEFLWAVLSGVGWVPYNQLTDEQLDTEYNEMLENS